MAPDEPSHAPAGPSPGGHHVLGEGDLHSELRGFRPNPELTPYATLLGLIAATFAIEGITTGSDFTRVVLTILIAAVTLLSLRVARASPAVMRAGWVLAAALVLTVLVQLVTGGIDDGTARVADAVLVAVAPPAIFLGVVRRLRATRAVTIEAVLGVLCVYILLGMFFAFVYGAIDQLGTGSFFEQGVAATASRCQYYSFTTLATVGYGDLTARSNFGHTLSVSEALVGQVYLVTVVSLIVGNLGRRRA